MWTTTEADKQVKACVLENFRAAHVKMVDRPRLRIAYTSYIWRVIKLYLLT